MGESQSSTFRRAELLKKYWVLMGAIAARPGLICKLKLEIRSSPIRYNNSKSFKLITGNERMDMHLKMISTGDEVMDDILLALGINEDSVSNGTLKLESTTWKFMNSYKRLESFHTLHIKIKLPANVDEFTLYKLARKRSHQNVYINVPLWKGEKEDVMDTTTTN